MGRVTDIESEEVNKPAEWARIKFNTCDTCANGIVTKNGVECGLKVAGKCKPNLLENPKFYVNWLEEAVRCP